MLAVCMELQEAMEQGADEDCSASSSHSMQQHRSCKTCLRYAWSCRRLWSKGLMRVVQPHANTMQLCSLTKRMRVQSMSMGCMELQEDLEQGADEGCLTPCNHSCMDAAYAKNTSSVRVVPGTLEQ
eukprot:1160436-Pelagomonas_calceolata.AAC.14